MLAVAVVFVTFAYTRSNVSVVSGYEVTARFSAIDGLKLGDDVRISGIKVSTVVDKVLDPECFQAIVHMSIKRSSELPEDTTTAVVTEGLLGEVIYTIGGAGNAAGG